MVPPAFRKGGSRLACVHPVSFFLRSESPPANHPPAAAQTRVLRLHSSHSEPVRTAGIGQPSRPPSPAVAAQHETRRRQARRLPRATAPRHAVGRRVSPRLLV